MPPHWLQAGPRSRPIRRAGTTGGVSVRALTGPRCGCGRGRGGRGRGERLGAAVAVGRAGRAAGRAGGVVLADLAGADLRGEDAELLLGVGVQEARGEPAHDVVGHRLGERDLRVGGDPFRLEAHVGELAHQGLQRHAVLERDGDRRGERVHHAAEGRALLADVGQEDLPDRAVRRTCRP